MAIAEVKQYFSEFGMEDRIIEVAESSATVALAAEALGTTEERIAKTMGFITKENPILVVMAGDAKIDNQKYKGRFKTKAKMIGFDEVLELTTHQVGGVCPFAVTNKDVVIYLDESLKRFDTVFPACGSPNSAIEVTIPELEKHSNFIEWIDVTKVAD